MDFVGDEWVLLLFTRVKLEHRVTRTVQGDTIRQ
jgi:hypothetical protein